jgi:hypothetical protein
VVISLLIISAIITVTLSTLHWNYVQNIQRKMTKKHPFLDHWGKHKPFHYELDRLDIGDEDREASGTSIGNTDNNEDGGELFSFQ